MMGLQESLLSCLVITLSAGLISGLSPCTLPTILFVTAYVSSKGNTSKSRGLFLSLAFSTGIMLTVTLLGITAGYIGNMFMNSSLLNYITAAILLLMALWILDIITFRGFAFGNGLKPQKSKGMLGAFMIGIPFGISASPCTMPITISFLAFAARIGSPFFGGLLMFTYSLGRCIPIISVGAFAGIINTFKNVSKYQPFIHKLSAAVMILISFYLILIA